MCLCAITTVQRGARVGWESERADGGRGGCRWEGLAYINRREKRGRDERDDSRGAPEPAGTRHKRSLSLLCGRLEGGDGDGGKNGKQGSRRAPS